MGTYHSGIDLTLKHRASNLNANPDALSRNHIVNGNEGNACKVDACEVDSNNHFGIDNCFV